MTPRNLLSSWGKILRGHTPMLSIEITKECPLQCPGCYAYGADHLGGEQTLRSVADYRGDQLVEGVLALVEQHQPLQVSLVGGEPMIRHRELSRILPVLNEQRRFAMVVTSGIVPIPQEWMSYDRLTVAISIDGLPEHHDVRRAPATYDRIQKNIAGRSVNVHGTLTRPMLASFEYLEEYVRFWNGLPEVQHIWFSLYSPQIGEESPEKLTWEDRVHARDWTIDLRRRYRKLLVPEGMARVFTDPPRSPAECVFAQMSVNYTANLTTRVEPCVFGGKPDCSQCGCSASMVLHWIQNIPVAGPVRVRHLLNASTKVGQIARRLRGVEGEKRWRAIEDATPEHEESEELIQIR